MHAAKHTSVLIGLGGALALVLASVAPGDASHFGLLDKSEKKCRSSLAKAFSKTVTTADKTSAKCHKDRNANKRPAMDDCNDLDVADDKGKLSKSRTKLISTGAKKCSGIGDRARHEFISCPEPCLTSTGVSNPIAGYDEVARCLACMAGDIVGRRNAALLGNPSAPLDDPNTGKADQKCHSAIAKAYGKHLKTLLKNRTKCQSSSDKIDDHDTETCRAADPKGKIADAQTKAEADLSARCGTTDLGRFNLTGGCSGATDAATLATCASAEANTAGDEAFGDHYALPEDGTICPISITAITQAGASPEGVSTATRIDAGFTGLAHEGDFVHNYAVSYGLSCPSSTSPCGTCTIEGVVDTGFDQFSAFARCQDDTTIECAAPFELDAACAGTVSGRCAYFLGPPLPTNAGSTPACAVNRLFADLTGTLDPDTGETELIADLRTKVHLGITQITPCPVCQNDPVAQDGLKEGVCFGGDNDAGACDVSGVDATFATPADNEGVSLDCPPTAGLNVSSTGLELLTPITTGLSSLPFDTECGFPQLPGTKCACAVCSQAVTKPCASDSDCGAGEGTCSSNGQGEFRSPNGCSDQVCTPTGGGLGQCQAGGGSDTVTYCDGALRGNGEPILTCSDDADCRSLDEECGGDCGDCTITKIRSCFVDPIELTGTPDKFAPVGVSTFCIPPTVSPAINGAAGLVGPARTVVQLETLRNFF